MQRESRFELTATVISVSMFAESEQRRDRREPNSENACVLGVRMEQRKAHPIADIFPIMTEEETNDLANDILLHGQREPIWMYEGKILDGRNRHNACLLKGLEPRMADYDGSDPVAFAVSMNLKRRQLDDAQRSVIAAKLATFKRGDNQLGFVFGQKANMSEHARMGLARGDVFAIEALIEADRFGEAFDAIVGVARKSAAPGFLRGHDSCLDSFSARVAPCGR